MLKSVAQVDIQNHESTDSDVDVETSATPPAYAGIAVEGAAWTTYTLWHWAHSPIQEDILKRARAASTPQTLRALLAEGSVAHKIFALNELTRRNDTTPETVQAIIQLDTEGSSDVVKAALDYWEQAPSSVLTASFVPFYHASSEQARIILLGAIRTSKLTLNATQLEQLSSQFSSAWSYQEVDLLFGLMEQIDPPSTEVVKQTLPLLQNKDFLTARRAYWYLSDHPALTAEQQVLLHHFEQKHEDRL